MTACSENPDEDSSQGGTGAEASASRKSARASAALRRTSTSHAHDAHGVTHYSEPDFDDATRCPDHVDPLRGGIDGERAFTFPWSYHKLTGRETI